jgi:hypothetical protein
MRLDGRWTCQAAMLLVGYLHTMAALPIAATA